MRTVFLVIIALSVPHTASACTCDVGTIDDNFEDAIAVFHIRVTATELRQMSELDFAGLAAENDVDDRKIAEFLEETPEYVRVSFKIIEVFKGESGIPAHLHEMPFSPGNCGLGLMTGIEYVIFLSGSQLEFASFCSGSFGFFNAEGTEIEPDLDRLKALAEQLP